jgi:MFS family permease
MTCLGIFMLGDLLCGFSRSAIQLYIFRAIAGIGGGGINSLCMIIVSDIVSLKDRGKVFIDSPGANVYSTKDSWVLLSRLDPVLYVHPTSCH